MKYGFFYNEFTHDCYYWEFVKMIEKLAIACIMVYFTENVVTKGLLAFLVIFIYMAILYVNEPYTIGYYR